MVYVDPEITYQPFSSGSYFFLYLPSIYISIILKRLLKSSSYTFFHQFFSVRLSTQSHSSFLYIHSANRFRHTLFSTSLKWFFFKKKDSPSCALFETPFLSFRASIEHFTSHYNFNMHFTSKITIAVMAALATIGEAANSHRNNHVRRQLGPDSGNEYPYPTSVPSSTPNASPNPSFSSSTPPSISPSSSPTPSASPIASFSSSTPPYISPSLSPTPSPSIPIGTGTASGTPTSRSKDVTLTYTIGPGTSGVVTTTLYGTTETAAPTEVYSQTSSK